MTRREALNKLPSPYNRQAIDAVENEGREHQLDDVVYCTGGGDVLWSSFTWMLSTQGHEYWSQICHLSEKHEQ